MPATAPSRLSRIRTRRPCPIPTTRRLRRATLTTPTDTTCRCPVFRIRNEVSQGMKLANYGFGLGVPEHFSESSVCG